MSPFYTPLLVIHVVVAVLGVGSIASVAMTAAAARKAGPSSAQVSLWMAPLLRYSAFSLAAMLVTGILMDLAARGAFHGALWFRASGALLLATGALHGWTRRTLRQNTGALPRVERIAYSMCVLIAIITILMEVKPL